MLVFSCTCPFYDVVSISNEQLEVGVNVEGAEGEEGRHGSTVF